MEFFDIFNFGDKKEKKEKTLLAFSETAYQQTLLANASHHMGAEKQPAFKVMRQGTDPYPYAITHSGTKAQIAEMRQQFPDLFTVPVHNPQEEDACYGHLNLSPDKQELFEVAMINTLAYRL